VVKTIFKVCSVIITVLSSICLKRAYGGVMNLKLLLFTLFSITLLSLSVKGQSISNDIVYIHTADQKDFEYLKNNNDMHSLSVATNLYALSAMPQAIKFEHMTAKRSLKFMEKGDDNICLVNKLKTKERVEKFIFTLPINLFLGRRLYQNSSFKELQNFDSYDNYVKLDELFRQKPDAKILISNQISYGDVIDNQLSNLADKNKIIRHSPEQNHGLINMFSRGYIEFSLLYPQQVYYSNIELEARTYRLDNSPPFVLGHIMCNKTPATAIFIKQLNSHLSSQRSSSRLLDIHLQFVRPADQEMVSHYFHQAFLFTFKKKMH